MSNRYQTPNEQSANSAGVPYAGAFLYFYLTGTSTPTNTYWNDVVYGNGKFVAVMYDSGHSANYKVMTSPNGITWTLRATPAGTDGWLKVAYGNGLFVALSQSPADGPCMTSIDGICAIALSVFAVRQILPLLPASM